MLVLRGGRRTREPTGPRRRRPSVFVLIGLALAATTAASLTWGFAVAATGGFVDQGGFVNLGAAGFVTAVLGWAAFSPTLLRAVLRPVVPTIVFTAFLFALVVVLEVDAIQRLVDDVFRRSGSMTTILRSGTIISVDLGDAADLLLQGVLGVLARASAVSGGRVRRGAAAAVVVAAVLLMGLDLDASGTAQVLWVVSTIWLVWALRRARAAHLDAAC